MELLEVLEQCSINDNVVTLPQIQLDRKLYQDVAKKIELIGGKWNRKAQGFLFQENPTNLFKDICNGDNRNIKKEFQFFATPDALADELCSYIPDRPIRDILEPSAGQGALIQAINKKHPNVPVYYCELMELNRKQLKGNAEYLQDDFLTLDESRKFEMIIANPPFSKNQDIDHFMKMFNVCSEGGRIISIMSKHWQPSQNRKETQFREFLYTNNAQIINIEAGSFKESGTNIASCIVILDI